MQQPARRSAIVTVMAAVTAFILATAPTSLANIRTLTIEERVQAQRAIEDVYWRHRIWPKENPAIKPPLSAVMSDEAIRAKVEDVLRKSSALESFWNSPISPAQLQAEVQRMARDSRQPGMLAELFEALGNDPFLIAEALARPALADRMIRQQYGSDSRFHAGLRERAEATIARFGTVDGMKQMDGAYSEVTLELKGPGTDDSMLKLRRRPVVSMSGEEWDEATNQLRRALSTGVVGDGLRMSTSDPLPLRRLSPLGEDDTAFSVTAILSQRGSRITIATVRWPKISFDVWWAAEQARVPFDLRTPEATYSLPTLAPNTACTDDTWTPTKQEVPDARYRQGVVVWTGTEMIIWGGSNLGDRFNTGGRYNPTTDTWTLTSTGPNCPSAREDVAGVWTGSEMIVWGGFDGIDSTNNGGRYNPVTNAWTGMAVPTTVEKRRSHTAVWTGSVMIVWGGNNSGTYLQTGGRYDPASDSWSATSLTGAPATRDSHTAVWTGSQMIVWGGYRGVYLGTGGRYDPVADTWVATSLVSAPAARSGHTAVWTGSDMIVWGGYSGGGLRTGGRYNPSTDTWVATSLVSAPAARSGHTAVWTTGATTPVMIVWGGFYLSAYIGNGGEYNPATNTWTTTGAIGSIPTARSQHAAVWTTGAATPVMIVWGGYNTSYYQATGARYDPTTRTWTSTSEGGSIAPAARFWHNSVWTGSEMIVWGGYSGVVMLNTGSRYTPATDSWTATSTGTSVPSARNVHTAVWTGSEMIVWGGSGAGLTNTGGRYNPSTDTWLPTSTEGSVPDSRWYHGAVWTGSQMIIWGGSAGSEYKNTGGIYDPVADSWTATSSLGACPSARALPMLVWTGSVMLVWGGDDGSGLGDGARYDPLLDTWSPISAVGAPSPRVLGTAVWTGTEMIVWGGWSAGGLSVSTGGRYNPSTDSWVATSTIGAPSRRDEHGAVWTGSEMLVWGGEDYLSSTEFIFPRAGGRYEPSTDSWLPMSVANSPSGRVLLAGPALWTGSEMIVWGGGPLSSSGGLYCAICAPVTLHQDADGDGAGNLSISLSSCRNPAGYVHNESDCNDTDASVWSTPGEVTGQSFAADKSTLSWTAPTTGGTSAGMRYDTLSTPMASDFVGAATCLETNDGPNTVAIDPSIPAAGTRRFYLTRAMNSCPGGGGIGSLGINSYGVQRPGRICP